MRRIPLDNEYDMLDALGEITHLWGECVYNMMSDKQLEDVFDPLYYICDCYNDGEWDPIEETNNPAFQAILKCIPESELYINFV